MYRIIPGTAISYWAVETAATGTKPACAGWLTGTGSKSMEKTPLLRWMGNPTIASEILRTRQQNLRLFYGESMSN
ncbi:MAG: hypothetical protein WBB29_11235 [Geitlerinemataceae cyanobacterium]